MLIYFRVLIDRYCFVHMRWVGRAIVSVVEVVASSHYCRYVMFFLLRSCDTYFIIS